MSLSAPGMPSGDVGLNGPKKRLFGKFFKKKSRKHGIGVSGKRLLDLLSLMLPTYSKRNSACTF